MASTRNNSTAQPTVLFGSTTRVMGLVATAAALLLMLSMGMTKAGAQTSTTYPVDSSTSSTVLEIKPGGGDDEIIESGEPVQFVSNGWTPGSVVTITIHVDTNGDGILEDIVLTATADENGEVTFDWDVPAGTGTGDYSFDVEGIDELTGEPATQHGSIHIEEKGAFVPGDGGGSGPLPYTGSNSTNLVRIGLVLIVAGGISVVAVRRRNAHADA